MKHAWRTTLHPQPARLTHSRQPSIARHAAAEATSAANAGSELADAISPLACNAFAASASVTSYTFTPEVTV